MLLLVKRVVLIGLVGLAVCAGTGVSNATDVVVVCPQVYRPSMGPWIAQREQEGLKLVFCEPKATAEATAVVISAQANSETKYILLVGDCADVGSAIGADQIPTFYQPSKVTARFGSTPTFPSDWQFGDFDNDQIADASVGRLPVSAPNQLDRIVRQILEYETSDDFGWWRNCFQLTGGIGGFGGLVDGAIESVTRTMLTSVLPAEVTPQIAYASPGHMFCPDERPFASAVFGRYRQGARFWVYAGHGSVDRLDLLKKAADDAAGLSETRSPSTQWSAEALLRNETAELLAGDSSRGSIGVLLACYAGAYDAPGDCLAERLLLSGRGPVAMIAASRLTMPYGNARFGLGLLEAVYQSPPDDVAKNRAKNGASHKHGSSHKQGASQLRGSEIERIGDAVLSSVRLLQNPTDNIAQTQATTTAMVDAVAALISPAGVDLVQERREHAGLYQLLGDPTLRLHPPDRLQLAVERSGSSVHEKRVTVTVESPIAGTLTISIDRPLGAVVGKQSDRFEHDPHRCTVTRVSEQIGTGETSTASIDLPDDASGPIVVRARVEGAKNWATAATRLMVR